VLIIVGAGAPGKAALSAANAAGLAYCLLALAIRLDNVPGWVPGVETMLERNLAHGTREFKM
jgi:hypothetical protein